MAANRATINNLGEKEAWNWLSHKFPPIAKHLEKHVEACRKRQDQGDFWWEVRPCDYYQAFEGPKIIFPDICKGPRFVLDTKGFYLGNTGYCLGSSDPFLLGLLNSKLFWFAISNISIPFGVRAGQFRYRLIYQYMEKVPIRVIDQSVPAEKRCRQRLVAMVEQIPELHNKLAKSKTPHEKTLLQAQIAAIDRQIDQLVYELYDLSEAEIKIVEEATASKNVPSGEEP